MEAQLEGGAAREVDGPNIVKANAITDRVLRSMAINAFGTMPVLGRDKNQL